MKKFIKILSGIICMAGFLIMLGSVGSADLKLISLAQTILQCAAGIAVMALGLFVYVLTEEE